MARQLQILDIPCGRGGINRSKNLALLSKADLAIADGITVERDVWEKELGATNVNSVALTGAASVTGLWEFITSGVVQELVAYIDSGTAASIVTVTSGGVGKTMKTALATGRFPTFTEGWDGATKALYMANGSDPPQVYTGGASTSNLPSPPSDWSGTNQPTQLVAHGPRMVGFGNSNFPHQLYLSIPGEHGDMAGAEAAIQRVYPGEGEKIVACVSWRERLYIFKYPRGIYILEDQDPNIANWRVIALTQAIGVSGPGCVTPIEDDIVFLASNGFFYSLSQIQTLGQVELPPLLPLETNEFIKEEIDLAQLSLVQSVWYGYKRKVMFQVPAAGSSINNRRIDIDIHEANAPKVFFSRRDTAPSIALRRQTITDVFKPAVGDNAGFVADLEKDNRNKNGAAFNGQFETPPVALYPNGEKRGNLRELEVTFQPQGNWDVTYEIHRDGKLGQTIAFSQQTPGAATGSFTLDADVTAGNTVANVKHRLEGDCRYVKLLARNNVLNQNFRILTQQIKYVPGSNL